MSHFQPRKRFGQHFLHDAAIIERIVQAIRPAINDKMLEIGPGLGALTQYLLPHLHRLTVVELDKDLIPLLKQDCENLGELIVYQGDILKLALNTLENAKSRWRIVGNLPYNISTPLLFHLLEQINSIIDMHFMLQKEVVERIVAKPGDPHYGRLSVMIQYFCQVKKLFIVKRGAFKPPPKVDSAIIRLTPYVAPPYIAHNYQLFSKIVRTAFSQRRKMLRNNLEKYITSTQLEALHINPTQRPETLSIADYVKISNACHTTEKYT